MKNMLKRVAVTTMLLGILTMSGLCVAYADDGVGGKSIDEAIVTSVDWNTDKLTSAQDEDWYYEFNFKKNTKEVMLFKNDAEVGKSWTITFYDKEKVEFAKEVVSADTAEEKAIYVTPPTKGRYYIKIAATSAETFTDATYTFIRKVAIETMTVNLGAEKKVYTGEKQYPGTVTIIDNVSKNGVKLEKGEDYTISYGNNKKVGKATVTIKGKGAYFGTKEVNFYIVPKATTKATAKLYKYNGVKLTWKKVEGATGYRVETRIDDPDGIYVKYLGYTTKNTFKASGLKYDIAYGVNYLYVTPVFKDGNTQYYSEKSKTTVKAYPMKKMIKPTVKKYSNGKVRVSFAELIGADGYQISRAVKKTGTKVVYKTIDSEYQFDAPRPNAKDYMNSRLVSATRGKTYYYKVRAYTIVNGERVYSPWSNVKAYKIK